MASHSVSFWNRGLGNSELAYWTQLVLRLSLLFVTWCWVEWKLARFRLTDIAGKWKSEQVTELGGGGERRIYFNTPCLSLVAIRVFAQLFSICFPSDYLGAWDRLSDKGEKEERKPENQVETRLPFTLRKVTPTCLSFHPPRQNISTIASVD